MVQAKGGDPDASKLYQIKMDQLVDLMQTRGEEGLKLLRNTCGGVEGVCKNLQTDPVKGLDGMDMERRCEAFGRNYIPPNPPKSFWRLMFEAVQDVILITLIVCAFISFALSFYHPKDQTSPLMEEAPAEVNVEWIEGLAIIVAVVVVVFVTAFNDWSKERQFRGLQNKIEEGQKFSVFRNGVVQEVLIHDIVVGDICLVKYGDLVPADALVLQCNDLKVDESSLTGESNLISKSENDPFLLSGTHIMEGSGKVVIVAVGLNSQTGKIFSLLSSKREEKAAAGTSAAAKKTDSGKAYTRVPTNDPDNVTGTELKTMGKMAEPGDDVKARHGSQEEMEDEDESNLKMKEQSILQRKLTKLAIQIGYVGLTIAILTVAVLVIRFCIEEFAINKMKWSNTYFSRLIRYLITGITVLVVAVPEGLPLAVTLSLAYAVKKMMTDNNLVRHLDACETMGNATAICSDKTGTLTTNRMTVVRLYVEDFMATEVNRPSTSGSSVTEGTRDLLSQSISINTNYGSKILQSTKPGDLDRQVGNKTECALLGLLCNYLKPYDYNEIRNRFPEEKFTHVYTFNSVRKNMSTVVPLDKEILTYRLFCKGAGEIVMQKCAFVIRRQGQVANLTADEQMNIIKTVIEPMASDGLRTICLAYKDYVKGAPNLGEVQFDSTPDWDNESAIVKDLVLIAICGIEDPVRGEVPAAIQQCHNSGIVVRMVTGDNVNTARSIAQKCGIISPHTEYLVLEGKEFNELIQRPDGTVSQKQFDGVWPRLRVLARSSPQDKYILVKHIIKSKLNKNREVVAVTGDGTNDGPALKKADVGFAMGIQGTDVAKEACDIILTDDNFTSIVKAVMWGRNVYDSIAKFLQFQLTVNVVAVTCAFVGACVVQESPLRAVQMLWVNLIMDTLASLALATEPPTTELLQRKPYGRNRALISRTMMKNIIGHSIYQLTVMFLLLFGGSRLFDLDDGFPEHGVFKPSVHFTMIFNSFVLMTLFNEINCRKIHGERNVFTGILRNPIFYGIWIGTLILQVILIQFGGIAFACQRLPASIWLWCILFGLGSLLWGQVVNAIPAGKTIPEYGTDVPVDVPHFISVSGSAIHGIDRVVIPSSLTKGQVLWLRGITRLQTQIRVLDDFQAYPRKPTARTTF